MVTQRNNAIADTDIEEHLGSRPGGGSKPAASPVADVIKSIAGPVSENGVSSALSPASEHGATSAQSTVSEHGVTPVSRGVSPKVLLAYFACAVIWGTTWYAIRVCIQPTGYPVFAAAALRFSMSAVLMVPLWFAYKKQIKKPTRREMTWIAAAGVFSGLAYGLLYAAEEHLTGGIAAVIAATSPLVTAIIAMATGTEKLSRATIIGSIVSIIGVALVFHDSLRVSPTQASAVGLLLLAPFLNASSNVVMKKQANGVAAIPSNTIFLLSSSVLLWIVAGASGKCAIPYPLPQGPTLALLYLSLFGTLAAFACFFYLLKHVRLSTAMTLSFVTPLIALFIDALFEQNGKLSTESYVGCAVVLLGVGASLLFKARKN